MTPLLEARHLTRRFGGLVATNDVSLAVLPNELHALIGPNGAGKTTLIALLDGALSPDAGQILLAGHDITALSTPRRAARGLARSFQITSIFPEFTALDNVALAVQARAPGTGLWRPARADAALRDPAMAVLARIGLADRAHTQAARLAHGEKRALELAMALAMRPLVLLLDEPMAGMGPEESRRMVDLLNGLRGETTMLLVEHDMDAVFALADRISVLVHGRLIATDHPAVIRADPAVRAAYLGEDVA